MSNEDVVFEKKLGKGTNNNVGAVVLDTLTTGEDFRSVDEFIIKYGQIGWNNTLVLRLLSSLDNSGQELSVDQLMIIVNRSNWDIKVCQKAVSLLKPELSVEHFFEIAKHTRWNEEIINQLFSSLSEGFSFQNIQYLGEQLYWEDSLVRKFFSLLKDNLTFEQVLIIAENSGWRIDVISGALNSLQEPLSYEQFLDISRKSNWNTYCVYHYLKHSKFSISHKQFYQLLNLVDNPVYVSSVAYKLIDKPFSLDEIVDFVIRYNLDTYESFFLLNSNQELISVEKFYELAEKVNWNKSFTFILLKRLNSFLDFEHFIFIAEKLEWEPYFLDKLMLMTNQPFTKEQIIELISGEYFVDDKLLSQLIFSYFAKPGVDREEIFEALKRQKRLLLIFQNFEFFDFINVDFIYDVLKNKPFKYPIVIENFSNIPKNFYEGIIVRLLELDITIGYLSQLIPYAEFLSEKVREDFYTRLFSHRDVMFLPELIEKQIPKAIQNFISLTEEDKKKKIIHLWKNKYFKALLILIRECGYSDDYLSISYETLLSELEYLLKHCNYEHFNDLLSLGLILFPDKHIELDNIRETFSAKRMLVEEKRETRRKFVSFNALKEIFDYYVLITLNERYNFSLLPRTLTSQITDKIDGIYEKLKEYLIIAVSSELSHSKEVIYRLYPSFGPFLFKFGSDEDIRIFFEKAKNIFFNQEEFPSDEYGGKSWAIIADFGEQFWRTETKEDFSRKISLLNVAVSLQHNTGYFLDKDNRIILGKERLKAFLDFEAQGKQTFESLLNYGLVNRIISQEEYDNYLSLNESLLNDQNKLPTQIDTNQIYFDRLSKDVRQQIEVIQKNPNLPLEIKMEAQTVFDSKKVIIDNNYRFYLSRLLKTISIDWTVIDENVKIFQSGVHSFYNICIAGYELTYWYENGKLVTINSMNELRENAKKLSKVLNKPIVEAQFSYLREGD